MQKIYDNVSGDSRFEEVGGITDEELEQAKAIMDILKYDIQIGSSGTKWYHDSDGEFHRDEGPAIEYSNGDKHYYQHGILHRDDGPAIDDVGNYKKYYKYGKLVDPF
jgi:hypothetical protein